MLKQDFLCINVDGIEGNCTWNKISTHSILGSFKLHVFLSFGDWIHEQNPPILVSIKIQTLIIRSLCICGYFMLNVLATNSSLWLNLTKLYILQQVTGTHLENQKINYVHMKHCIHNLGNQSHFNLLAFMTLNFYWHWHNMTMNLHFSPHEPLFYLQSLNSITL